jgi:cation diffusion facilitator family transporter
VKHSKRGAAVIALITVLGLFALKLVVGWITGSISIFAQMADSFLDILSVALTFIAIIMATKPADSGHPFGHGKLENLSAVVQAVFILIAAGTLIYSAVQRIINGAVIEMTQAGMAVMALSAATSLALSRYLKGVARDTDSPALEAIMRNISADVYSATGVLIGLTVIFVSGGRLVMVDPVLAILVSLVILKSGFDVIKGSFGGLIDARLPESEESRIKQIILSHNTQLVGMHALRSRKSGSMRYVDLHLVMPGDASVEQAHEVCDHLETDLKNSLPNLNVTIHVEPCASDCANCAMVCNKRSH